MLSKLILAISLARSRSNQVAYLVELSIVVKAGDFDGGAAMSQLAFENPLSDGSGLDDSVLVLQRVCDCGRRRGLANRHQCVESLTFTLETTRAVATTRARSTGPVVLAAASH